MKQQKYKAIIGIGTLTHKDTPLHEVTFLAFNADIAKHTAGVILASMKDDSLFILSLVQVHEWF